MKNLKIKKEIFLLILFVVVFYSLKLNNFLNFDLDEPKLGTYRNDEMIFLKTFYLIKKGENYYQAFREANEADARIKKMTPDVFTWRLPTIFYIWNLTANDGFQIFRNFWILTAIFLICIYLILVRFIKPCLAILGPILLVPYFLDTISYKTSFLFTEWWSLFFFFFGLTFFLYKKTFSAGLLFLLAAITRELIFIPLFSFFIFSLFLKKNRLFFSIIIMFTLLFFIFHQQMVFLQFKEFTSQTVNLFEVSRIHGFWKLGFQKMTAFSMRSYPLIKFKSHYWLIFLAFLSFLVNIRKNKDPKIWYLFLIGWVNMLIFPFITSSQYNDYWGILFMPALIMSIPFIFLK